MMETITQNCGLYLAHKLTTCDEEHRPNWWRLGHASKGKRIVLKRKGLRRFPLQKDKSRLSADRFLLL
jgi:hypothetical protein